MKRVYSILLFLYAVPLRADDPLLVLDTRGHMAGITSLAFTRDQRYLVSAGVDKVVRIWDVQTGETVRTIRGQIGDGQEGKIFAVALSPDNRYLAAAGLKMEEKEVERAGLGFIIQRERDAPARVGEPVEAGVPLQPGDTILEINGRSPQRAQGLIRSLKPGDEIKVKVQRDGKTMEVSYPAPRIKTTSYVIAEIPGTTEMQAVIRRGWLASRAER